MSITKQLSPEIVLKASFKYKLFTAINAKIEAEKENAFGIAILLMMLGTMIASITAALAIHNTVNYIILPTTLILAMGANTAAISQQPFKIVVWAFIINISINTLLLFYQLIW